MTPRILLACLISAVAAAAVAAQQPIPAPQTLPAPATWGPDELLPVAPKVGQAPSPLAVRDLAHVPIVEFQDASSLVDRSLNGSRAVEATKQKIVNQISKIQQMNRQKRDGFISALVAARSDLAGLPFVMGDACRLKEEDSKQFNFAVTTVQNSLQQAARGRSNGFWDSFETQAKIDTDPKNFFDHDGRSNIAALMQIMPRESASLQPGLVQHLRTYNQSRTDKDEATKALARLSIFSMDAKVRRAAGEALLKRPVGAATEVLLKGLRYPWPAIAQNAADAIVRQQREDLVPELIKMLEEPDPRTPVVSEVKGKKVPVVRELVRVNHLRSCLMCHSPATGSEQNVVLGAIPNPAQEVPSGVAYYSPRDMVVRADVTYLRQDFSMMHRVPKAAPWPAMQRFDYLVRTRVLAETEAVSLRTELASMDVSPYRQAALSALRGLTGRDAGSTAQAWRTALHVN